MTGLDKKSDMACYSIFVKTDTECTNRLALATKLALNSSCLPKGNITVVGECEPFNKESLQFHEFEALKKVIWTPQVEVMNLVKVLTVHVLI